LALERFTIESKILDAMNAHDRIWFPGPAAVNAAAAMPNPGLAFRCCTVASSIDEFETYVDSDGNLTAKLMRR
jgi:hypothetical protein